MYNYANDKYGDSLNSTRFFETSEVKNADGKLFLPKGKVVDSNFTIPNPTNPSVTLNPVVGISNFVYEYEPSEEVRVKMMELMTVLFEMFTTELQGNTASVQFNT